MFKTIALLLFALAAITTCHADSQNFSVSWAAPTEDIDGSPIPAEEITGYLVYFSLNEPVTLEVSGGVFVEDTLNHQLNFELPPGEYVLYVGVVAQRTQNIGGESVTLYSDVQPPEQQGRLAFTVPVREVPPNYPRILDLLLSCTPRDCQVSLTQ